MIDFTNSTKRNKAYNGANGSKISIIYNGNQYMLKFPAQAPKNDDLSYANSCVSEYLGSHIFQSVGIETQETLLGTYRINGKKKIVVACKDFTSAGIVLQDFASLKNSIVDSEHNGYGTELADIMLAIEEQTAIDNEQLKQWFWDTFIIDALIGNWDRHNGNWGFLYNTSTDELSIAPVYDCGSCLFPQVDEAMMIEIMSDKTMQNARVFERPLSSIRQNDKKINYHQFITSFENKYCNEALMRIVPRIKIDKINNIIDDTPYISQIQKDFYKFMIKLRKEKILDEPYNKLIKMEHRKDTPTR